MKHFIFFITVLCLVSCKEQSDSARVQKKIESGSQPSLKTGVNMVLLGGLGYVCTSMIYPAIEEHIGQEPISSVSNDILLGASYYQMMSGVYQVGHYFWNNFYVYIHQKSFSEKRSIKEISSDKNNNPSGERVEAERIWRKSSSVIRSIMNLASSTQFAILCLNNTSINPSLSCNTEIAMVCYPFVIKTAATISTITTIYNLWDLIQNLKQREGHKGEVPLMGLLSGFYQTGLSGQIHRPQIITVLDTVTGNLIKISSTSISNNLPIYNPATGSIITAYGGSMFGEQIYQLTSSHGTYQIFANLFQCIQNSITPPELTLEINTYEDETYSKKNLQKKRIKRNLTVYNAEPYEEKKTERSLKNVLLVTNLSSNDSETSKPPKIKRRGKPTSIEESNDDVTETEDCLDQTLDPEIEEALEEINSYRRNKTVKKKVINSILDKCCKRIEGKISPIDGSEYAIVFFVNGRKVSIKFEIPHGQDSNVYRGSKLTNVLNAIETAYMYHLDEGSIKTYMQKHGVEKFHHIPKHLVHILFKRPDF